MAGGFNVGTVYGDVKLETSGFNKGVSTINKGQKDMTTKSKTTGTAFKGMWKQMAAGVGVTTLLSSAFRGISRQISDTIQQGIEFGREWANVTTMLSISQKETENLREELLGISPTLGNITDLARGMYQVLSASIEPAKAIKFLGEAAKSAKAGVTDTATAVDALTTVINAYGMEAEEVTDVSDIMFATVKRGKLTYGELASSLGTVVPVAATVGVGFEDIAAAIATMTRQGIDARTATMQLRQVFMSILGASDEVKEFAKSLGIEFTVTALKTKGLGEFMKDLKDKVGNNAEAMKKLVPNARALTGAMVLAGEGAEGFAEDLGLMADASGATEEAFKKQMESAGFWVDTFKNQVSKMKVVFFAAFVDGFGLAVENSKELEARMKIQIKQTEQMGTNLGNATRATTKYLKNWSTFGFITKPINALMKGQAKRLIEVEERQEAVNRVVGKVKGIFDDAKDGLDGFLKGYEKYGKSLVVVRKSIETSVPVTSGMVKVWDKWRFVGKNLMDIVAKAPATMKSFTYSMKTAVPPSRDLIDIIGNAPAKFNDLGKAVTKTGKKIKIDWEGVAEDMSRVWAASFQGMMDGTATFADFINSSFDTVASGVSSTLGKGLTSVIGITGSLAGPIGAVFSGVISGAMGMFKKLLNIKSKAEREAERVQLEAERMQRQFDDQMIEATSVMSKYGDITEATAEKIVKLRETYPGYIAESLALADVIADVGVNQDNLNELWSGAIDVMHQMAQGQITTAQGTEVLNDAFTQLKDGAIELGEEGGAGMTAFILQARATGVEVKAMTDYILEQFGRVPDALSVIIASQEETGQSLEDIGAIATTTFEAMQKEGMAWTDVVEAMSAPLSALKAKYEEQGIVAEGALAKMFKVVEVTEANKELFDAIEANKTILEVLRNTVRLSQEDFERFAGQAYADFKQLEDLFGDDETALQAMAPTLQLLADEAEKYGFEIDENTAKIIQQAKNMGLVTEAQETEQAQQERLFGDLGDKMADIMQKLGDRIADIFDKSFGSAVQSGKSAANSIDSTFKNKNYTVGVDFAYDTSGEPDYSNRTGKKTSGDRGSFAKGTAFIPQVPTPIIVHSGELVDITPLRELGSTGRSRAGLEMSGGKNDVTSIINIGSLISTTGISRSDLEKAKDDLFSIIKREERRIGD